jgi:hypothetical protein
VQHLVGNVVERYEMVLAAILLSPANVGEERIMAAGDGDLGGLYDGGAQVRSVAVRAPRM